MSFISCFNSSRVAFKSSLVTKFFEVDLHHFAERDGLGLLFRHAGSFARTGELEGIERGDGHWRIS